MPEIEITVAQDFLIALLIGALVGIEREKSKAVEPEHSFAGLRTFMLFALAGALGALFARHLMSPWPFIAVLLAVTGIIIAGYIQENRSSRDSVGLTTEVAALTVTLLGGAVIFGYASLAVALAISTSAILAFKQPMHAFVAKLGRDDIYAALKLLIATFIVLPFLPDAPVDPWQALNPYKLWLLVIFISGLSLAGYVAVRWLGDTHGTLLTGLAGGLASSTAVTLAFARRSIEERKAGTDDILAAGILLSWTIMFIRVLVEVAVVNRTLLPMLIAPYAVMTLATLAGVAILYARAAAGKGKGAAPASEVDVINPFSLTSAVKFGALFALVLLLVKMTQTYFPTTGLYAVAALVGLSDVDALTLSMAEYAQKGGSAHTAVNAIVIASLSNTIVKCAFTGLLGSPALCKRIMAATALIILSGLASIIAT
jgi:uncharacterized membrane protein (DUF4010 family)